MIEENENAVNDRLSIQKQIILIQQENQRIINELKLELTKKEHEIIELEKSNNLLRAEVEE